MTHADGDDAAFDALAGLVEPCRHAGAELILATSVATDPTGIHRLAPQCRLVSGEPGAAPADLRLAGARAASGDVVLFVDDVRSEQWQRIVERLDARRISVVGALPRTTPAAGVPVSTMLSVIVPAHDAATILPETLGALRSSDLPVARWELIVVDDASTDETAAIASQFADVVVRIPQRAHGPSYARNRGFEAALGTWAVFLDADVKVKSETLRSLAAECMRESTVGAIVGSYDAACPAPGIVAQYRNLLHHYAHRECAGDVESFWAACGAVRSDVFADAGMFDEWHYPRPMIEGVELGQRIRGMGRRIVVTPHIQATHLKSWSLLSAIVSDLRDHAVPWMRLLMRQRVPSSDRISLNAIERINRVGTWIALIALCIGSITGDPRWVLTMGIALLPVIFANRRLYSFFERQRGPLFALAVIPLHLLYYVLLALAIIVASVLHLLVGDPRPAPVIEAYAEVGFETWPPVPNRRAELPVFPRTARV
ncbi:MAG: glycosyltransferase [Gemmatimonadaceae bacterium]